ncbi:tetratricopeptide repeat-containing sensor histidine kinase [Flavobacterium sp. ASW18X]|uniref:tetratricopeptide repeat-containing sensor histidine kinase n=1 Tax=Flavobacterium sp. ASW18X TaxID=2572595 RepID=UPI00146F1352|nr:tetratricopeptide repeat-containing sensor histidine kinase [Flavobacterium sp. ASW18X]
MKTLNNIPQVFNQIMVLITLLVIFCQPAKAAIEKGAKDSLIHRVRLLKSKGLQTDADEIEYVNSLVALAKTYRFVNVDSLYALNNEAIGIIDELRYSLGKAKAYVNFGLYYTDKGEDEKAIYYLKSALMIAEGLEEQEYFTCSIFNDIGSHYRYAGDFAKSLDSYLRGLDIAKTNNFLDMQSVLNENIASLYSYQNEFEQSLLYYKQVLRINEKLNDPFASAQTNSNLGSLYSDMEDYEKAMYYLNKSIHTFEKLKEYDWLAYAYNVKGEIYIKQKKYQWALYWLDQSRILHEDKVDDERGRVLVLNNLSESYLGINKDSISKIYAQKSFDTANQLNDLEGKIASAKTLYSYYKKQEDSKNALYYHEVFKSLTDTLTREENKKSLTMLKTQMNYERQKEALIAENEKNMARQKIFVSLGFLIVVILIGFSIPLYVNQKKLKKLYHDLKINTAYLEQREQELEKSNTTKDKLFSIIGHDLRSPIGALQGLLEMLVNGDIALEDSKKFIARAKTDVDHMLFTLNNILSWGQTQLNGTVTRPSPTNIYKLVNGNVQFLQELADTKNIKIINEVAKESTAFIDENQIDVVIRNLISNAIKFTPENGLISLESEENLNYWTIKVRDTGIGMNNETKEKIFSPNLNYTTYGTNNEKGTGLGLSLCKEMIEKNNGKIWVESTLEKGSTFFFTVPKVEEILKKAS